MKFFLPFALLAVASCAPVSLDSTSSDEYWTTLTPLGTLPASADAVTSTTGSFALSIRTIAASVSSGSSVAKRGVSQISDGQIQADTSTVSVLAQITDGQVQEQTTTTASVINQISDGQIQAQSTTTASVINQISDGQVQAQSTTTASVINQISDGQVQEQTTTTASVINQISDGQVQAQSKTTADAVSQISDGQIQGTKTKTAAAASQVSDGQVQDGSTVAAESVEATSTAAASSEFEQTCVASNALTIRLTDGQLRDSKGRVGAIVANRQFQFDGPPPQAGTIYAAGWSFVPASYAGAGETSSETTDEGWKLALGNQTTFFKCLSGDFYNLYDELIGGQCSAIEIFVLEAVDC